jgi:UPF0755 protein
MKRWLPLLTALFVALVAPAVGLQRQYAEFLRTPLALGTEPAVLHVARGASVRSVVAILERRGMTVRDWRWRLFTRLNPATIMAGEYELQPGMRPPELLDLLASGRVKRYRFTIVEGWTFARLRAALDAEDALAHPLRDLDGDAAIMAALGAGDRHPEGWFLPETYQYVRGDADLDMLQRAYGAMVVALRAAWEGRAQGLPVSGPYELLILASIIEKESSKASERAEIAGVLTRRLQQRWRLETDPTVIYGLGENFDGDIRSRDLQADNPYNTYTRYGLPPTPIALPSKSALRAAAHPADGTAMFFVADGQGGHVFSDTLEEHNEAVRRMLGKKP